MTEMDERSDARETRPSGSGTAARILHYSDPHVLPRLIRVPVSDYLGKRLTGALSHLFVRRKKFPSVRRKLARLAVFAREQDVDLVVCTGDHTMLGTDREMAEARVLVEPFTRTPLGLVTVPGNHDLYTPDTVRHRRFENHFGDFLGSDLPDRVVDGPWPLVRLVGEQAAVIAINSSRPHRVPWRANGRIPDRQLEALQGLLADDLIRHRFIFVLTHHAPVLADGRPDRRSHGLLNAADLMDVLTTANRSALLFGHVHQRYSYRSPDHTTTLFNAGSATLLGHEGLWLFDVRPQGVRATPGRWRKGNYELDMRNPVDC